MTDDVTRIKPAPRPSLALRSRDGNLFYVIDKEMLVGREVECQIQLNSLQVSRYHAKLTLASGGLLVEDLDSSNGTFVNGRKVRTRTLIGVGDQVSFDEISFRVTTVSSGDAEHTRLPSTPANTATVQLKDKNVDIINRIGPAELKPAPSSEAEKQRALSMTIHRPAGGIKPVPPLKKAPEIVDMEAFLRHAGSSLKRQQPLSGKESLPFGLSSATDQNDGAPQEPLTPPEKKVERQSAQANKRIPSGKKVPQTLKLLPKQEEDENTRHISVSTLNHYVSTNKNNHVDLDIGSGPRLIAMTAPIRCKVFSLEGKDEVKCWSLGRDDRAHVCIRDKAVSREHAWITKLKAAYKLRVNDVANVIYINGKPRTEANLRHGDRLQLGAMELVFKLDTKADINSQGSWAKLKNWMSGRKIRPTR